MAILGDDFWGTFTTGLLGDHVQITVERQTKAFGMVTTDQQNHTLPSGALGDIGAIER
jgi:hypothetical protein